MVINKLSQDCLVTHKHRYTHIYIHKHAHIKICVCEYIHTAHVEMDQCFNNKTNVCFSYFLHVWWAWICREAKAWVLVTIHFNYQGKVSQWIWSPQNQLDELASLFWGAPTSIPRVLESWGRLPLVLAFTWTRRSELWSTLSSPQHVLRTPWFVELTISRGPFQINSHSWLCIGFPVLTVSALGFFVLSVLSSWVMVSWAKQPGSVSNLSGSHFREEENESGEKK